MRDLGLALALLALGAMPATAQQAPPAAPLQALPAVVHVHSTLSTGAYELDELAVIAEREGIGALLLSENYLLRIEYGLPPFRALTRVVYQETSVLGRLDDYVARVAQMRRRFPGLVIVPGVEVMPHYHWSGTPLALELRLHDTQKNLLVFGLTPEALGRLPVTGNPGARRLTARSLVEALPALLVVPGLVVLARPRVRRVRLGVAVVKVRQRRWLLGGALLAIGVATIVRGWPFTIDRYPPWTDYGLDPHQAVIDAVESAGGAVVWSFPEAPDVGERKLGPVRVHWRTAPYPDDLLRTSGYTAFGGVYEQPTQFARPGGGWDRLLGQYASGERSRPAWAVGESGFHAMRAGKRVGPVQTVFFVRERSEAAVLDALKRGRMYAVRRSGGTRLSVKEMGVFGPNGSAGMGDTLKAAAATPIEVRATVEAAGDTAQPVRVTLVKDGVVAATWVAPAPLSVVHRDTAEARRTVYRLEARVSTADYLLANPVFVAP
jgi:hypothetical protein